jgi:hypothetical protein
MERERIIDKVRKAIALSTYNPSAEEGQTALLKAQELMAKHNIGMDEVGDKKIEKEVVVADLTSRGRTPFWKKSLAKVISENFRCMAYTSKFGGKSSLKILGLTEDVELAKEMFDFAVGTLEYSVGEYMKRLRRELGVGGSTGVRNDYILGFIKGLNDKFRKQVEQNNWALVLVKDELVTQHIENMRFTSGKTSKVQRSNNKDAYNSGYERGKTLSQRRKELTH